jgi:hypothetical protein
MKAHRKNANSSQLTKTITTALKRAVAEAIERHRRLGEPIIIAENGKVTTVPANRIPPLTRKNWKSRRS